MSMGQWYVSRGRIRRRVFWLHYMLPIVAIQVVATAVDAMFGLWLIDPEPSGPAIVTGTGVLGVLASLALLVPSFSSQVTRLHDRGHSAWWLLWMLLPLVGAIILIVQTGFLRGDGGPNRYGPAPDRPVYEPVS